MRRHVIVLGAGMVGTSTALQLALRGQDVTLVDHQAPGRETSYGNAGLIQSEAVRPYAFPTDFPTLWAVASRRGNAVRYRPGALPRLAPRLYRYWRNSLQRNYGPVAEAYAALIRHATAEHALLLGNTGADDLIRRVGWRQIFRDRRQWAAFATEARAVADLHGLAMSVTDGDELAQAEPALRRRLAGSIHWQDPWSVRDPGALVERYAQRLRDLGGRVLLGDALTLQRQGAGWRIAAGGGIVEADAAVVSLGPWSDGFVRRLGYDLPLFVKRGYHRQFACATPPATALLDMRNGVMLAPMQDCLRVTTGAEFAMLADKPSPVQLGRSETYARELLAFEAPTADPVWMGARPCTVDMLPVIGPAPRHAGLWFNFGHGHQGHTLGPVSGRVIAEMICGEPPLVASEPYRASRFDR